MNKYNEIDAVKALNKKNGISINKISKAITIDKTNNNLGNSSLGKIDYLTKVHGYVVVFTTELGKKKKTIEDDTNNTNSSPVFSTNNNVTSTSTNANENSFIFEPPLPKLNLELSNCWDLISKNKKQVYDLFYFIYFGITKPSCFALLYNSTVLKCIGVTFSFFIESKSE